MLVLSHGPLVLCLLDDQMTLFKIIRRKISPPPLGPHSLNQVSRLSMPEWVPRGSRETEAWTTVLSVTLCDLSLSLFRLITAFWSLSECLTLSFVRRLPLSYIPLHSTGILYSSSTSSSLSHLERDHDYSSPCLSHAFAALLCDCVMIC